MKIHFMLSHWDFVSNKGALLMFRIIVFMGLSIFISMCKCINVTNTIIDVWRTVWRARSFTGATVSGLHLAGGQLPVAFLRAQFWGQSSSIINLDAGQWNMPLGSFLTTPNWELLLASFRDKRSCRVICIPWSISMKFNKSICWILYLGQSKAGQK